MVRRSQPVPGSRSLRAYDVALRAFPTHFRERWGDEMRLVFAERLAADRARRGRVAATVLARELSMLVLAGVAERLRPRHHGHTSAVPDHMIHLSDIRHAFRLLGRSPLFTLLTVLVLAGGLGLSTFTFSFLYTAMIRPLPLDEGDRIVRLDRLVDGRRRGIDATGVELLRGSLGTLTELGAYSQRELTIGGGDDGAGRTLDAIASEPVLLAVARTPAFLGRTLIPADAEDGAEPVIVLSYRSWEVAFGADRALVGSHILVDGVSTRLVGVMPPGFGFPVASEAWVPLPASATSAAAVPGAASVRLVARLAPGVSHAAAAAQATPLLRRLAEGDTIASGSARPATVTALVESFPSVQFGEERMLVFTALNLVAALILLLALVNVVNLLLARANERIRETAVRLALGASTARLVTQGMWETVILCVAGGVLGTVGAAWGLAAITGWTRANMEGNLAFWWVWRMDHVTVLCAGAFVTVAVAFMGSVVAYRTTRTNVREVLQDGGTRSGSRQVGRLSRLLVATQVMVVTVLMYAGILAGVMAERAITIDPGFDTTRLLQGGLEAPPARYTSRDSRAGFFRDVKARLAERGELDGVLLRRTLADRGSAAGSFELRDPTRAAAAPRAFVVALLGDLSTVGATVLEGRPLTASDDDSRQPVAMVSRSLAARYWPGRSPVGDQLRVAVAGDSARWVTVVGVTSDTPHGDPLSRERSTDAVYLPLLQTGVGYSALLARYRTDEAAGREALRLGVAAVDPLVAPDGVQPFDEVLRKIALITTSVSRLFAACFAFALLLALVGTFGLMTRAIGLRMREIGVRRALGATEGNVTRLMLRQGGRQLGVGTLAAAPVLVVVGLTFMHFFPVAGWIAIAAGVGVSVSIVVLILAASWVPTRRLLRVSPREALWAE